MVGVALSIVLTEGLPEENHLLNKALGLQDSR